MIRLSRFDEATLIEKAACRDEKAFEALYRLHVDGIYTLALRMTGNIHTAEDITQEIFVRVWQKIETFRGRSSFNTWLYRLSMNIILRQRSRLEKVPLPVQIEDIPGKEQDPAGSAALRLDLQRAVSNLPLRCRGVLVLHEIIGLNHKEIGRIMKITTGTSKAHLHKAKILLRKEMDR